MLHRLKTLIPASLEPAALRAWFFLRPALRVIFLGTARYCPVCRSHLRRFLAHGPASRRRHDVVCPLCLSHDRHRSAWLYLTSRGDLWDGRPKRMLHFAPEPELARLFRSAPGIDYLSADLDSPHAMLHTDITAIRAPEASFDLVYCSHVLEHVADDRQAMKEIHRVLKPGGWAMIQVPMSGEGTTLEDPSVIHPDERERLFWQHDHIRLYGSDIVDRLAAAGFDVRVFTVGQFVSDEAIERQGLWSGERIFACFKESSPS